MKSSDSVDIPLEIRFFQAEVLVVLKHADIIEQHINTAVRHVGLVRNILGDE